MTPENTSRWWSERTACLRRRCRCACRRLFARQTSSFVAAESLAHADEGSSLIEFAVSLSVLMTFTFALMEMCVGYYTNGMISEVAREGSRYAIVHGSTCTTSSGGSCTVTAAQVKTFTQSLGYPNPGGGSLVATASFPDGDEVPGHRVLVTISYSMPIRFPFIPTRALGLSASSEMTIVQ
jgi:Flp pilus assembly protein TadG